MYQTGKKETYLAKKCHKAFWPTKIHEQIGVVKLLDPIEQGEDLPEYDLVLCKIHYLNTNSWFETYYTTFNIMIPTTTSLIIRTGLSHWAYGAVAATAIVAGLESYFQKPSIKINPDGELPKNPSPEVIKVNKEIYSSFNSAMNACKIHNIQRDIVYQYKHNGTVESDDVEPFEKALKLLPSRFRECQIEMQDLKKLVIIYIAKRRLIMEKLLYFVMTRGFTKMSICLAI